MTNGSFSLASGGGILTLIRFPYSSHGKGSGGGKRVTSGDSGCWTSISCCSSSFSSSVLLLPRGLNKTSKQRAHHYLPRQLTTKTTVLCNWHCYNSMEDYLCGLFCIQALQIGYNGVASSNWAKSTPRSKSFITKDVCGFGASAESDFLLFFMDGYRIKRFLPFEKHNHK